MSKKKNAELAAERQAIEKAMEGSAEAIKTNAVLEEYKVRVRVRGSSSSSSSSSNSSSSSRECKVRRRLWRGQLRR